MLPQTENLETHLRVNVKQRSSLRGLHYLSHKAVQKMEPSPALQQMFHAQTPLWECAQG